MSVSYLFRGQLRDLSYDECWGLLLTKSVGRIAFVGADGPEVLPFNFVVDDATVLVRTSPYGPLARQLPLDVVAFQVDEVDGYTESGWSVLLRGPLTSVDRADLPAPDDRPEAWPAGQRSLHLRLTPRRVTGRRLVPA